MHLHQNNRSSNFSVSMATEQHDDISKYLTQIIPILMVSIGLIGNAFVILILRQKSYSHESTFSYMRKLAWSDIFVILMVFMKWLDDSVHFTRYHNWSWLGYMISTLQCISIGLSTLILVLMLLDR